MENSREFDDLLKQHFAIDELKNISSYEKLRYFNIWKNYEMLISIGLNPPIPKFLKRKVNRGKETAATSDDSEGLIQDFLSKVAEGKESKKRKAADPMDTQLERRVHDSKTSRQDSPREEQFVMQKQLEISKNDCEDCCREYVGPCPDHDPMTFIANTKVPKDGSVTQRALTSFLSPSVIRKAPRLFPDVYYHTCDRCGQRFTDVDVLQRHEKGHLRAKRRRRNPTMHISELQHACNLCPKTFAQKGHLQRHSLVHSGEKPHACPICHSAFARAENLREHERSVHSEVRSYSCSVCGKDFDDNAARMRHQCVHSGQQPHCCPHCDRRFSKSGHLKQHMDRQHKLVFLYSCRFCKMGFWTVGELKAHVQKNHLVVLNRDVTEQVA